MVSSSRSPAWFERNPGAPFVVAFIFVLVVAAVSLALGHEDLANDFATVAYYFLVIGVILQLVALAIEGRRSGGSGFGEGS